MDNILEFEEFKKICYATGIVLKREKQLLPMCRVEYIGMNHFQMFLTCEVLTGEMIRTFIETLREISDYKLMVYDTEDVVWGTEVCCIITQKTIL